MNRRCLWLAAICLFAAMSTSRAATVTWDGGGGDFSWQTPSNWDGDTLPGPDDTVVINRPGVLTVSSSADVSIQSLQCSNNLSIVAGVFSVTANASVVRGDLSLSGATALVAGGPGTSFTANGPTTAGDADFVVSAGATVSLPGLQDFTKGCVGANWMVTGSNSVLDLPALTNLTGAPCNFPSIQVTWGGRLLAPSLATITAGPLTFVADGEGSLIDVRGLQTCAANGGYALKFEARNGGRVLLMATASGATMYGVDLNASGGGVLSLPGVEDFAKGCVGAYWTVTGSNSVLDLPALTNISGAPCNFPAIQVTEGGRLLATNLATITAGPLTFLVDGTGSLIDLSGLRDCAGNGNYPVDFVMGNGGIILAPALTTLYNVDLKVSSGVLSLPGLRSFAKGCVGANWQITGSNSVLDLPALTNISGEPCNFPAIQVTAGGRMLATNLTTITAGPLSFVADGDGSLIDFSGLRDCAGNENYALDFDARNGGTVKVFASPLPGHGFHIILKMSEGGMVWSPNLSTLENSDLIVSDGVLALPGLQNFTKGCVGANWTVTGSNSVLDLPALTNISGAPCTFPAIQVTAGGRLLATTLATITAGPLTFLADGENSLIDFSGLQMCAGNPGYTINFDARNGGTVDLSSLTNTHQEALVLETQNEGNLLFAGHTFFITGVTIKMPPLATILPPTFVFHGQPWHSYLIEKRNTLQPENPWTFVARVPMTNQFQAMARSLPPDTEFRATEFVADPPVLDLGKAGTNIQLVLYGAPPRIYTLQSTNRLPELPGDWPALATVTMTNAFRILPLGPPQDVQRFFKARE